MHGELRPPLDCFRSGKEYPADSCTLLPPLRAGVAICQPYHREGGAHLTCPFHASMVSCIALKKLVGSLVKQFCGMV